jgi:peptide/nickel transport system substrate-binding protein
MNGGIRDGGTLTMVLAADPPGLDPVQLMGVQNWAEALAVAGVYDQLFTLDTAGRLQPKIGASLVSEDGGASWTLTLRPGVRFSDGQAFDAEAVRFNWARLAEPANRAPAAESAAMIRAMEVAGPLALRVALHAPQPRWDRRVARSLSSIGSPAAIEALGPGFSTAPVGAGPFQLAEWVRGDRMRLVRNPDYWRPGKPHLDAVVVLTGLAGAADKFAAMDARRAQVSLEPVGPQLARYRAQPQRFELKSTPQLGGGVALALNLSRPPFDDARVRRALALALDSAAFVELCEFGDPQMVMTSLDRPGTPYHDPQVRLPAPDLAGAQRLIDAAGPVRFTLETFANEGHVREAGAVKRLLESRLSGVEVAVAAGAVAEVAGKWRSGEYQACNYAVGWSDPALDLPAHFASTSPQNVTRYASPAVDAALSRLTAATDPATAAAAHREILTQALEDLPFIWLSHKEAFHVVDRLAVADWPLVYSLRPLLEDVRLRG